MYFRDSVIVSTYFVLFSLRVAFLSLSSPSFFSSTLSTVLILAEGEAAHKSQVQMNASEEGAQSKNVYSLRPVRHFAIWHVKRVRLKTWLN